MTIAFRWWRLCFAMLALLSILGLAGTSMADTGGLLRGKHIIFVEPYGPGSATDLPIELLRAELASKTGASIEVKSVGGRAGGTTLDYLLHPPAAAKGSLVFGVLDITSRLMAEMAGGRPRLLERVQAVAIVSTGASAALIVSDKSPIKSIDDFLGEAHKKQLRLVHLGRKAVFGIELAMLEKSFGLSFADKVVSTRAQILAALASGEADAGFLVTYTLLPSAAAPAPPVRPILTFGAEPNPDFVVPTLKQRASNPKAGISSSIAVFAPHDMPKAVADALEAAMAEVADDPEIQQAAMERHFPLEVEPAAAVLDAMKRSARVIKDNEDYINR
jgi:tripartite-type tricarboxylate transporter receptor subunit TctC